MKSDNWKRAQESVGPRTPDAIVEQIAAQMDRADEAAGRIEEEGVVVRDMKGSVVPHPAIAVEQAAAKMICDLIAKHTR